LDCNRVAEQLLNRCLAGTPPRAHEFLPLIEQACAEDPDSAVPAAGALFGVLAEGLADRFEERLVRIYADIFSHAIACADPRLDPGRLVERYERVRRRRGFEGREGAVSGVVVLSRITLGADIAVTSVLLSAVRRRFPQARIVFAAPEKNWRLFAGDSRLEWLPVQYRRSATLRERLAAGWALEPHLNQPGLIVVDPDSRLTQLGLLPICPEENYFLFESRSYGGDGEDPLPRLAARWAREVFGVPDASPYFAVAEAPELPTGPFITVNLGVGDNPRKRLPDPFEPELLRGLAEFGLPLVVDLGGGEEEEARVRAALRRAGLGPEQARLWQGSFASLAALIARSRLYVGYDSGGQHAAAAAGVPLVTVFAGYPSLRMLARWTPFGAGPREVIRAEPADPAGALERTLAAARRLIRGPGW
jgi:ADP-heptose:LPS heptosyltransferase